MNIVPQVHGCHALDPIPRGYLENTVLATDRRWTAAATPQKDGLNAS